MLQKSAGQEREGWAQAWGQLHTAAAAAPTAARGALRPRVVAWRPSSAGILSETSEKPRGRVGTRNNKTSSNASAPEPPEPGRRTRVPGGQGRRA